MPRKTKRHTVEQVIGILREAETCGSNGRGEANGRPVIRNETDLQRALDAGGAAATACWQIPTKIGGLEPMENWTLQVPQMDGFGIAVPGFIVGAGSTMKVNWPIGVDHRATKAALRIIDETCTRAGTTVAFVNLDLSFRFSIDHRKGSVTEALAEVGYGDEDSASICEAMTISPDDDCSGLGFSQRVCASMAIDFLRAGLLVFSTNGLDPLGIDCARRVVEVTLSTDSAAVELDFPRVIPHAASFDQ